MSFTRASKHQLFNWNKYNKKKLIFVYLSLHAMEEMAHQTNVERKNFLDDKIICLAYVFLIKKRFAQVHTN